MKPWTELTEAEIDTLEGYELSHAVGDAMGIVRLDGEWVRMPGGGLHGRCGRGGVCGRGADVGGVGD